MDKLKNYHNSEFQTFNSIQEALDWADAADEIYSKTKFVDSNRMEHVMMLSNLAKTFQRASIGMKKVE